ITLLAFIAGSVVGTAHMPWWSATPSFAPVSIVSAWGPWTALIVSLFAFALLAIVTLLVERTRSDVVTRPRAANESARWLHGPWPLAAGAIGLALVNIATLLLAGRPWGITSAFALWGAKALAAMNVNVEAWPYWATPAQRAALHAPLASDVTSVMD